jgi:hypothetical protein
VYGTDGVGAHLRRVGVTAIVGQRDRRGAVFRQLGNIYGEAAADHSIGLAWRDRGRPWYAERYLRRAISLYQDLGRRTEEAAVARDLAAARSA